MSALRKGLTYWHTIRHMRAIQISNRIWRRLYYRRPDLRPAPPQRTLTAAFAAPVARPAAMTGPSTFRFLGISGDLAELGWDAEACSKLWRYNLHYFDDLNAVGADSRIDWHRALIRDWMAANPPGRGTAWEPYPTSLRAVNWIKWGLRGAELDPLARESLAVQARWLYGRLEYHLLGNHLMANAKALCFLGLFFSGAEAQRWFSRGREILSREIPEQVLEDGGHFERSPMYHLLALEDLLDLVNLFNAFGRSVPAYWRDAASRMLGWSAVMRHPDGDIPFFNDAALGIAPQHFGLAEYAQRVGVSPAAAAEPTADASGYVRMLRGAAELFLDVGPLGPDYLPGHAHADSLSFELALAGRRLCVNSGTSTYEIGELRHWQRGTASHNTVTVDGCDSSEVWASFRVARRARVTVHESESSGSCSTVAASHDGYRRLRGRPRHDRQWSLFDDRLVIEDRVVGRGMHTVVSHLHFHPAIRAHRIDASNVALVDADSGKRVAVLTGTGGALEVTEGYWYPRFGAAVANHGCRLSAAGRLPVRLGLNVVWAGSPR